MNSSTSRTNAQKLTQEQIKRQIAELQARLAPEPEEDATLPALKSPKRKAPEAVVLAPATPSPKKKRKLDHQPTGRPLGRPVFQTAPQPTSLRSSALVPKAQLEIKKISPSTMLNKLASLNRNPDLDDTIEQPSRSTGFAEKALEIRQPTDEKLAQKRDERLALIENLEPGPYEHTPPHDDPDFAGLEPHSGINLTSRKISHEDFSDYLRGRYYLSPSRLYSAVRLLPDKQGYDVPVAGDWITIGVVAERGPIKFTRAPVKVEREDGDEADKKKGWKGKANSQQQQFEPRGKKFVNLKLIDFGARSEASSSSKSVIRGDAFLTLLLFEADSFELVENADGRKQKIYRGGSRGAFEHLTEVKEGDVIALLNPKILKPFQRSADTPHPVNNVLAVTPESASSIMVIGRCRDLGMCQVRRQDGKVCGSWCDKRVSDVCEYHVQTAVQRRRAARPEFSISSGGMSTTSTHKRKHDYDPRKQWGLKPEDRPTGPSATYLVAGHIVSGSSSDPRTLYATESIGREGQAKAKRVMAGKDADKTLARLLERDKDGMKAVMKAREVGHGDGVAKTKGQKGKKKMKDANSEDEDSGTENSGTKENNLCKTAYSAAVIKGLGFDPSLKPGQRRLENAGTKNKLEALEAVRAARKDPELGPKPGPRIRSGVIAPPGSGMESKPSISGSTMDPQLMHDLDDSGDDEFPELLTAKNVMSTEQPTKDSEEQMVDLDDL